jgi:hypothetical protein
MEKGALLPLFYLPPIEFFSQLLKHRDNLLVERFEHFPKQTYRNRASIHSPNGKLDLIIPVVKGANLHSTIKDVKISYDFKWQRQHLMSLQTAYRSSAYFEFYEDSFMPFYEKRWQFLFDYNEELLQLLLKSLKIDAGFSFTEEYFKTVEGYDDFRESIHPKQSCSTPVKPYFQVFEERNGFIENLSIVDLLFNQGPQSNSYLI